MDPTQLSQMWIEYKARPVDMTLHTDDQMYNTAVNKPDDYLYCGRSAIECIMAALAVAPTKAVRNILDFGCGHGRVARQLRAFFPGATMAFADNDTSGTAFCAETFNGRQIFSPPDFNELRIADQHPDQNGKFDLIWLGSIFTHVDYARMQVLFDTLFDALTPSGLIIGTFRGHKLYERSKAVPEIAARDADLIAEYEAKGYAYKRYQGWEADWGLSLVRPDKLMKLGERQGARLVMYGETIWANAHDVGAWTNTNPATNIR